MREIIIQDLELECGFFAQIIVCDVTRYGVFQDLMKESAKISGIPVYTLYVCELEVSCSFGSEGLDATGVAVFAENVSIQRITTLIVPLREKRATALRCGHTHKHTKQCIIL